MKIFSYLTFVYFIIFVSIGMAGKQPAGGAVSQSQDIEDKPPHVEFKKPQPVKQKDLQKFVRCKSFYINKDKEEARQWLSNFKEKEDKNKS